MKHPSQVRLAFSRNGLDATAMVRQLQTHGYEAFLAGGCVRDLLLGRTPHDYDIATDASPNQILEQFPEANAVGRSFPVVRLTRRGHVIDIASFRQEGAYLDGRHPSTTSPGTLEQDAQRRDFTINALYLDPANQTIVDEVGGMDDLRLHRLRFVGDPNLRLEEDHLRLMRAIRFASTLGFNMDDLAWGAVQRHSERLSRISPDRVRDELVRCLTEAIQPANALRLLTTSGLLPVIIPDQPFDNERLEHVLAMFGLAETKLPELMLAILLHTHESGDPRRVRHQANHRTLEQLRFSNDFIDTTLRILALQDELDNLTLTDMVRVRHLIAEPCFPLVIELYRVECLLSGSSFSKAEQLSTLRNRMPQAQWLPSPWVTGEDLKALGLPQGPSMAQWKRLAHDQQLLGNHPTKAALLDWLRVAIQKAP